jgi:hypothetical protein
MRHYGILTSKNKAIDINKAKLDYGAAFVAKNHSFMEGNCFSKTQYQSRCLSKMHEGVHGGHCSPLAAARTALT